MDDPRENSIQESMARRNISYAEISPLAWHAWHARSFLGILSKRPDAYPFLTHPPLFLEKTAETETTTRTHKSHTFHARSTTAQFDSHNYQGALAFFSDTGFSRSPMR